MTAPARVMPLRSPIQKAEPKRTNPLRLVPQRRSSAAKAPFVVVLVLLLAGGLLGLLVLNTLVAKQSFVIHDLAAQDKKVAQEEQNLAREVQGLQTPAALAARAGALHMVPSGPPAFLDLRTGRVLGIATAGVAPVVASTTWTAPKPPGGTTAKPGTTTPTGATKPAATKPTGTKPAAKPTTTKPTTTKPTGAHR